MTSFGWVLAPVLLTAGFSLPLVDRLVFFPDRAMPATPSGFEDRWLTTDDGVRLHAWYAAAPSEETAPTLLWAHGNGGNIGGRFPVQAALAARAVEADEDAERRRRPDGLALRAVEAHSILRAGPQSAKYRRAELVCHEPFVPRLLRRRVELSGGDQIA